MCKSNNLKLLKVAVEIIIDRSFKLPEANGDWVPQLNKKEIEFIEAVKRIENGA